ncbi:MAG TPA: hypothetical protein VN154_01000 [Rhizomicrobium sp.]|nr:hypothetical protein [Rhizomicrobium sp.]
MNAPLLERQLSADGAILRLFALFHLNLAFSSIEEEQRGEVIRRCYWPLLELARDHGPIAIEATAFTLEEIAARDTQWCQELARLRRDGRVEFIGSGYAQIIGPLVPAGVTEANLRIGHQIYERILGSRPDIALVNEQAYSAGLVGIYLDAAYRAILMDWDNPAAHHPEWPNETRYQAQRALAEDGRSIALLWTNTVAFQKLQRLAHDDIGEDDYLRYVTMQRADTPRTLCLYASDAEIFDFRPGRYRTEEALHAASEWMRVAQAFARLKSEPGLRFVRPSDALEIDDDRTRPPLRLESAPCPVPVKKQRKYNLSRWAVTGLDDIAINAACERIYRALVRKQVSDEAAWKELCYLWSSDFRTHITDARWSAYCRRLTCAQEMWSAKPAAEIFPAPPTVVFSDIKVKEGALCGASGNMRGGGEETGGIAGTLLPRRVAIGTPSLIAQLDRRRGLAITSLQFAGDDKAIIGGLPHGHFDAIDLQADWYTGDCVFEAPGEAKITDLEWCEPDIETAANGDVIVRAKIATPKGPIFKQMRFSASAPAVAFDLLFDWQCWDRGVLRLGHITLLPNAFAWASLSFTTHNGGKKPETFSLAGETVDHGAPVSFLVSSSFGIGMTEGWAELGDANTRLRVDVDRQTAPLLGFVAHKRLGGSLFCQLILSALELDETRKPSPYRAGPRRFRFSVSRVPSNPFC